jgi:flagellar basal-body rod protein FlgB
LTAYAGFDAGDVLRQAMKVCEMNHRMLANNVANAETPGYRAVQLDFKKSLDHALQAESRASLRDAQATRLVPSIERSDFKALASFSRNDYNTVDIDNELVRLSENTGNYTVYSTLLSKRFGLMKNMLNMLR